MAAQERVPPQIILFARNDGKLDLTSKPRPLLRESYEVALITASPLGRLLKTLWLLTYSDIKTIVVPSTFFGVANALAFSKDSPWQCSSRSPSVMLWVWLNLLPFTIGNQRSERAIMEDSINKPWRPFPSGRLNTSSAGMLLMIAFTTVIAVSTKLGGCWQSVLLVFFDTWYNHLGGGDANFLTRYFINACGYLCFLSGALNVAQPDVTIINDRQIVLWLLLLGAILWTTIHIMDLEDEEGDRRVGRSTAPTCLGDVPTRIALCILIPAWTTISLRFWDARPLASLCLLGLGGIIVGRTLTYRTAIEDKKTFRIWNIWLALILILPLWAGTEWRWLSTFATEPLLLAPQSLPA